MDYVSAIVNNHGGDTKTTTKHWAATLPLSFLIIRLFICVGGFFTVVLKYEMGIFWRNGEKWATLRRNGQTSFHYRQWLGIRYRIFSLWARDTVPYP